MSGVKGSEPLTIASVLALETACIRVCDLDDQVLGVLEAVYTTSGTPSLLSALQWSSRSQER
jgi:hypothetical protein